MSRLATDGARAGAAAKAGRGAAGAAPAPRWHALQRRLGNAELAGLLRSRRTATPVLMRRPTELIDNFNFLGNVVRGGLNERLRDRLLLVEQHLREQHAALGPNHLLRTDFDGNDEPFPAWAGIHSVRSWRANSGTSFHASGSAVDVNYDLQPYIATRTAVQERTRSGTRERTVYGGEAAGSHLQAQRIAATEVYDRAVQFTRGPAETANVSARAPGESTAAVYGRLLTVDAALFRYFSHAFRYEPTAVTRRPIADIEGATEGDLLATIPETERLPEADAISRLTGYMDNDEFRSSHPGWPSTPRQQYFRILRDYEHVRIPMVRGNPEERPANTRNPTRGFLDMRPWFVEAMVDVGGLRWGAADFGAQESGDVHHFDLGNHGGVAPDGTP
jgi:hypothetical protein